MESNVACMLLLFMIVVVIIHGNPKKKPLNVSPPPGSLPPGSNFAIGQVNDMSFDMLKGTRVCM